MATKAATTRSTTTGHDQERGCDRRLSESWRHSAVVAWLLDQPRERRETILSSAFALTAVVWAPLGILLFLAQVFGIFLAVSALALVAVAAPRPVLTSEAAREHLEVAREQLTPVLRDAWRQLRTASGHVRQELLPALAALRADAALVLRRARRRTSRALAPALDGVRRSLAHARERLAELGPRPAQSSPRSAR